MRILMLAQSYAPVIGGEERIVQDLSRELVVRGHSVSVGTLCRESETGDDGVRVHRLRSSVARFPRASGDSERPHAFPGPDPETVYDLRRLVALERPDVVHAHNWIVHSFVPLRRRSGAPLVLSLHDYDLLCATKRLFRHDAVCTGPGMLKCVECAGHQYGRFTGAAVALSVQLTAPFVRRAVDMFIPISNAVRVGCGLESSGAVQVIPNFVRPLPDAPAPSDPRLAALPREPYILFFGDATVDKGARHLANVYRSLHSPPPLVFVGRCFVDELASIPGVVLAGALPHEYAIEAVRRSMFTVAPSLWAEPFGLVALETAAAEKPILASDIGGLRDIVVHGETGLLVAPADETALRDGLRAMIDDPDLRDRLGVAARERSESFSATAVVPRFEDAYRLTITSREPVASLR